ncbi:hypothetical protein L596_014782 [Steinernema carpocapsae]|uniref:Uncharacterized protein n=1 Tax=Steinernema carpocapsae TaxID=34508 RepID=A0A4U5ND58_STECR|nr:hypothetical protein L596_014782 [Steinernema carpocapsae]
MTTVILTPPQNGAFQEECIGSTTFTVKWVLETLQGNDAKFSKILEKTRVATVTWKPIGVGQGYVSFVNLVKIEFEDGGKSLEVVLRVPTNTISASVVNAMHNCE